jgi:hypothetical protein
VRSPRSSPATSRVCFRHLRRPRDQGTHPGAEDGARDQAAKRGEEESAAVAEQHQDAVGAADVAAGQGADGAPGRRRRGQAEAAGREQSESGSRENFSPSYSPKSIRQIFGAGRAPSNPPVTKSRLFFCCRLLSDFPKANRTCSLCSLEASRV